jgi:hypothetical protein
VIATKQFNVPYERVQYSHGSMGIATLALVYSQVRQLAALPGACALLVDMPNAGLVSADHIKDNATK